jgi:hypothetical protein
VRVLKRKPKRFWADAPFSTPHPPFLGLNRGLVPRGLEGAVRRIAPVARPPQRCTECLGANRIPYTVAPGQRKADRLAHYAAPAWSHRRPQLLCCAKRGDTVYQREWHRVRCGHRHGTASAQCGAVRHRHGTVRRGTAQYGTVRRARVGIPEFRAREMEGYSDERLRRRHHPPVDIGAARA